MVKTGNNRRQTWGQLMDRVDSQQRVEGEWEQLWPPVFLEKAVADLRIRLSDLRARSRKQEVSVPVSGQLSVAGC